MGIEPTTTEDIIFPTKLSGWEDLISAIKSSPTPDDFLSPQERDLCTFARDPFDEIDVQK
jgi:hypothetical protein